jgi:hypothetical protein
MEQAPVDHLPAMGGDRLDVAVQCGFLEALLTEADPAEPSQTWESTL